MSNPLIDQGQLNRLVASVVWQDFPQLNVTPSFLGKEAIRLALEGGASTQIRNLTGITQSPEPYMPCSLTINLLKTQQLSALFKSQMELLAVLGNCVVRPDVPAGTGGLTPYDLTSMAIQDVREQDYGGGDSGWIVVCRGAYYINSALWN